MFSNKNALVLIASTAVVLATPQCEELTSVFVPGIRNDVWSIFDQCIEANDCTATRNGPIKPNTVFHRINTGWDTDINCRDVNQEFERQCLKSEGQTFGGTDNSSFTWLFDKYVDLSGKGFSVDGPHPICFPQVCLSGDASDLFHAMKLWVNQTFLLNLTYMETELYSLDHQTKVAGVYSLAADTTTDPRETPEVVVPDPTGMSLGTLFAIFIPVLLVGGIGVFVLIKRRKSKKEMEENLVDSSKANSRTSTGNTVTHTHTDESTSQPPFYGFDSNTLVPSDQINIGKMLGRGTFGAVYKGLYLGKDVAIKVLFAKDQELEAFEYEVDILSSLHHPNIVQFIGTSYLENYGACALTEFMENGDLRTVLQKALKKEMEFPWFSSSFSKLSIATDVISGLEYLHSLATPIIHRDLKSRNILISRHFIAKIADFGISRQISNTSTMTAVGSNLWLSPEVLQGERYNEKADVYAFGVVLTELDTEQLPYFDAYSENPDSNGKRIKLNALALTYRVANESLRPSLSPLCNPVIAELAMQCMSSLPHERPGALEILARLKSLEDAQQ